MSARFAHLRKFDTEELYRGLKVLEELEGSEGWRFLTAVYVQQQAHQTDVMLAPPSRGEQSDSYALRQARASGVVDGVKFALDAPKEILTVAREELAERQRMAEQAVKEEE